MAGIGAGVTSKALGELIFGQPKREVVYGNNALASLQGGEYPDALKALLGSGKKATTDFTSALDLGTPEATRIQADDIANLGAMTKSGLGFDPLAYYNDILNSKVSGPSGIKSFIPDLLGASRANLARNRLALGLPGSAPTTYDNVASLSALGSSLAPILNGIYSTTGAEAMGAANARLANIGSNVNLMRERAGIPDRLAMRSLLPFQAETDILGRQLGLAGQLGDITKANIQGYEMKTDPWANMLAATGEGTDQLVDTVGDWADRALSAYTGGMAGGGARKGIGNGAGAGGGMAPYGSMGSPSGLYGAPNAGMGGYGGFNPYAWTPQYPSYSYPGGTIIESPNTSYPGAMWG